MANLLAASLKILFGVLTCVMLATLIYTLSIDGLPFRKDLLTPWMAATLVDFFINIVALAAWIIYRESNWISAIMWTILLVCFGSITTCAYITLQLFKLSSQEALQDPIYYVLLRHQNNSLNGHWRDLAKKYPEEENGMEEKSKFFPVVTARIVFGAFGCLMLVTLIYTISTDGSPFRKELLTPWMTATLIDFYINVVALSVWVAYKEPSWISAFFWIVLFICFGSITTCVYIVRQLFQLASLDPTYLVLFNSATRAENRYERAVWW